jgi:hypothetical protein
MADDGADMAVALTNAMANKRDMQRLKNSR